MKYSTVFVPALVVANGLLAAAMPAPAAPSSDMGSYKDRKPKQDAASQSLPLPTDSLPSPLPTSSAPTSVSSASSSAKSEEASTTSTAKSEESGATGVPETAERVPGSVESKAIRARGPTPEDIQCGKIYVQSIDRFSGFVQGTRDQDGRYTVGPQSGAVTVTLGDNVLKLDQAFQGGYPRIGATFGVDFERNPGEDNMAGNSWNFAYVTATGDGHQYGQPAISDDSSFNFAHDAHQHVESAIFYLGENGEIKAAWTNKNKQSVPVDFAVNPNKQLILGANVGAYSAHYSFGSNAPSARLFCRK
ncbi:SubName: Full=Uncharacterized protein {ECO:0000313/EMBL:CCA69397.1} [Serendipita indica DSM 11827]|nr:SubName: Full=Uncharacterized protein {ECO:0000313/EMBL:CCA69397.1} [Serendipita indica DSM 11827]